MDIGDEKSVNEQRAEAGRAASNRRVIWQTLLNDRGGRDFIWWLLSGANIFSSTYRGADTHATAFAEGQRAFMLPIMVEIIEAHPRLYTQMVTENATKEMAARLEKKE